MATRVSKHHKYNPRYDVDKFVLEDINEDNVVNHFLKLQQSDVSTPLIMKVFGSFNGKTLCPQYDTFEVPVGGFSFTNEKGKIVSNTTPFITTFGIWIFNIFFLQGFNFSWLFGGYMNENITKKKFEKLHQKLIYALVEDKIEVENYKKFVIYTDFCMPWETILSPAHTEAILSCTKEINKMKAKLIKENKEAIEAGDAAVVEDIEKKILDYFQNVLLKDDPALDPYLSGAGGSLGNNFKNMYIMKGAIRNPDPTAKKEFNIATSSFIDGITGDEYASLANSLPGCPYSRSKKTELGGYWEKLIGAALNTIKIDGVGTDCKTDKYLDIILYDKYVDMFMYSYVIKPDGKLEELTMDTVDKYRNKRVKIRFSQFCKSKTGVCNCCAGNFFYRRGSDKPGLACQTIPTKLKLRSMKAFHDSTVQTTEIDPMRAFGFK